MARTQRRYREPIIRREEEAAQWPSRAQSHGSGTTSDSAIKKARNDVYNFIGYSIWGFICLIVATYIGILVTGDSWISIDEFWWKILAVICLVFIIIGTSAMVALLDFPEFVAYIFKCASIINCLIIGIFSCVLLYGNNRLLIIHEESFVKFMNWICIIWLVSVLSNQIALISMKFSARDPKIQVNDFFEFILRYAVILIVVLLAVLVFLVLRGNGKFDIVGFSKLVGCLCCMMGMAFFSTCYVMFFLGTKWATIE